MSFGDADLVSRVRDASVHRDVVLSPSVDLDEFLASLTTIFDISSG